MAGSAAQQASAIQVVHPRDRAAAFIVPTALSAIAFWWIYDAQFSIISWTLFKLGWIDRYIDFLGEPWLARLSVIAANIWRGVPFVAICLLAGLQTISPSFYEAASLDGATPWQQFRFVTLPLLTPIIAVVMTFSVLFTFTDFQLIYVLTWRTAECHASDGHEAEFPARDPWRGTGGGRGARDRDGALPDGGDPVQLFRPAAPRVAAGWAGQMSAAEQREVPASETADSQGMKYLESTRRRIVTVYLPLAAFLFVLLFPFYWMAITTFKPNAELLSREGNPFWVINPTLAHIKKLLFDTAYPDWLWNTMLVSVVSTGLSLFCSVLAAYAIERLRFRGSPVGMSIFLAYLVPPSILFIPLAAIVYKFQLFDTRLALILTYPTF